MCRCEMPDENKLSLREGRRPAVSPRRRRELSTSTERQRRCRAAAAGLGARGSSPEQCRPSQRFSQERKQVSFTTLPGFLSSAGRSCLGRKKPDPAPCCGRATETPSPTRRLAAACECGGDSSYRRCRVGPHSCGMLFPEGHRVG